jgi:hypothetical protein
LTLPFKIDWQLSGTYMVPSRTAQGRSLGVYGINITSKDVLKIKELSLSILVISSTQENEIRG